MQLERKPSLSWQWNPTKRHLHPGDSLFEEGDIYCNLLSKQIPLESRDEFISEIPEFTCGLAGCKKLFNNLLSYECHYNSLHRNLCATCCRVFPSSYLLGLHIQEWHDAMFEVMCDKKPMYCCLLESCGQKFQKSQERKEHMINEHKYPANFRFDKQKKLKKSVISDDTRDINRSFSSKNNKKPQFSYKVPKTICFGQAAVRSFYSHHEQRHCQQRFKMEVDTDTTTDIEQVDMDALATALEECS